MSELVDGGRIAIVFNFGVNDLRNINKYLKFMNNDVMDLVHGEKCDLYYMSVNPVNNTRLKQVPNYYNTRRQSQVEAFNKKMKAGLNSKFKYIDTYSYMIKRYSTAQMTISDGLHYKDSISKTIFDRCMIFLKKGKM